MLACYEVARLKGRNPQWALAGLGHLFGLLAVGMLHWNKDEVPAKVIEPSRWGKNGDLYLVASFLALMMYMFAILGSLLLLLALGFMLSGAPLRINGTEYRSLGVWLACLYSVASFPAMGLGYMLFARTRAKARNLVKQRKRLSEARAQVEAQGLNRGEGAKA